MNWPLAQTGEARSECFQLMQLIEVSTSKPTRAIDSQKLLLMQTTGVCISCGGAAGVRVRPTGQCDLRAFHTHAL